MITIKNSIEIKATQEKIFDGLVKVLSSQEYYKKWHKDHVKCQWLKGKPFEKGSMLYIEEYLHGKLHKIKLLSTKLEPYRKVEYKLLFPMLVVCPSGSFIIEPKKESCIFTATLSFRFGWLFLKLARSNVEAVKKHMENEGKNLKELIEKNL
jgi:hypothetical protein